MNKGLATPIYGFTIVFFALFLAYPIWHTVNEAFVTPEDTFTLVYIAEIFNKPIYTE